MRLLTVTNLYPRPDQRERGVFNAQQFYALHRCLTSGGTSSDPRHVLGVWNLVFVPEWRIWRWPSIRAWQDPWQKEFPTAYLPTLYLPVIGRNFAARFYQRSLQRVRSAFQAADGILATWLYPDAVAAASLATTTAKPFWIKVHGSDRFHLRVAPRANAVHNACRAAHGIFCVSQALRDSLQEAGIETQKMWVVSNGLCAESFRYRPREEAWSALNNRRVIPPGLTADHRVILWVGNLVPIKSPDRMIEVWAHVRKHAVPLHRFLRLILIGDGPLRAYLRRRIRHAGFESEVFLTGSRPHQEISLWMSLADCLCLTSHSEGSPNVLREALGCGLPVVAPDVGGCEEILRDEPESRLCPSRAPEVLAGALLEQLSRSVDRLAVSARAHARWSWSRSAKQLLDVIKRTLPRQP